MTMADTHALRGEQTLPRLRRPEPRRPLRMEREQIADLLQAPGDPRALLEGLKRIFARGDQEVIRTWCERCAIVLGTDHRIVNLIRNLTYRLDSGERQREQFRPPVRDVYKLDTLVGTVYYANDDALNRQFFDVLMPDGKLHEPGLVDYLCRSLSEADIFVDIGAHTGYLACIAGVAGATVITMEFQQPLNRVIERNLVLNGVRRANVLEIAASDRDGMTVVPKYNAGFGSKLYDEQERGNARPFPPFGPNSQLVPMIRLDTLFADLESPPTLIKIDAEGFELRILRGAARLIAAAKTTFLVEYHCKHVGQFGTESAEIDTLFPPESWQVIHLRDQGMSELDRTGLRALIADHSGDDNIHLIFRPR